MATQEQIQEIKARTDIVELVGRYVKLKPAGKSFVGLCPFHNERTPSFFVNPQLGIFKCFACGKAGDVITFLQEIEHISFYEAISRLAKEAGVTITTKYDKAEFAKTEKIKELLKKAQKFYQYMLLKHKVGAQAREYAKKRGLSTGLINEFGIGYAPTSRFALQKYALKLGYTKKDLALAGLINDRGFDKFFDRLMFPIYDASGNIVGFSGRVIKKDDIRAKYLNTPETPVFKKRFILYGLYQAKKYISKEGFSIIVEGQMDVIASHKAGIKNIVAPLGTGLTQSQLMILKRFASQVVFAFDADEAGQRSLDRAVSLALEVGLEAFVVDIPEGYKDVDEVVADNPKLWENALQNKKDFFEKYVEDLKSVLENGSYSEFKTKLDKSLHILKHADGIKQEAVLKMFSDKLDIPVQTLRDSLNEITDAYSTPSAQADKKNKKADANLKPYDYFLAMLLNYPVLVVYLDKHHMFLKDCLDPTYWEVLNSIKTFALEVLDIIKSKNNKLDIFALNAAFSKDFSQDFKLSVLEPLKLNKDTLSIVLKLGFVFDLKNADLTLDLVEEFKSVYARVKKMCLSKKIEELQEKITKAELTGNEKEASELAKELQGLLDLLKEL